MPEDKLTNIFEELNRLSFRRQQLLDKRNILAMLIQFKRTNGQNEERESCLLELPNNRSQIKKKLGYKSEYSDF